MYTFYFRVWQDWIVENDTFVGMNFVMGEQCGAVDREAKVNYLSVLHHQTRRCTYHYMRSSLVYVGNRVTNVQCMQHTCPST